MKRKETDRRIDICLFLGFLAIIGAVLAISPFMRESHWNKGSTAMLGVIGMVLALIAFCWACALPRPGSFLTKLPPGVWRILTLIWDKERNVFYIILINEDNEEWSYKVPELVFDLTDIFESIMPYENMYLVVEREMGYTRCRIVGEEVGKDLLATTGQNTAIPLSQTIIVPSAPELEQEPDPSEEDPALGSPDQQAKST